MRGRGRGGGEWGEGAEEDGLGVAEETELDGIVQAALGWEREVELFRVNPCLCASLERQETDFEWVGEWVDGGRETEMEM